MFLGENPTALYASLWVRLTWTLTLLKTNILKFLKIKRFQFIFHGSMPLTPFVSAQGLFLFEHPILSPHAIRKWERTLLYPKPYCYKFLKFDFYVWHVKNQLKWMCQTFYWSQFSLFFLLPFGSTVQILASCHRSKFCLNWNWIDIHWLWYVPALLNFFFSTKRWSKFRTKFKYK